MFRHLPCEHPVRFCTTVHFRPINHRFVTIIIRAAAGDISLHILISPGIYFHRRTSVISDMQKITSLLLLASGVDLRTLEQCPSERNKYAGIGATIFFTGLFAAMAAAYALYTVFDSYWIAIGLGILWGLMIFNLDRYIVSSMRKDSRFSRELFTALPRIILAVVISIVIVKPLELKIFAKEIDPELVVMEQQAYAREDAEIKNRYVPTLTELRQQVQSLNVEITSKSLQRDALVAAAQQEADGTGGSKRRNLGPIYKVKRGDADKAELELQTLVLLNTEKIRALDARIQEAERAMSTEINALVRTKFNGPAARLEALSRLTAENPAMWWAHIFIVFLFMILECTPILVKLISRSGPYDSLIHTLEHQYRCKEVESIAAETAETKRRTAGLPQTEQGYVVRKLDAELT
jgi:hypothetical protein